MSKENKRGFTRDELLPKEVFVKIGVHLIRRNAVTMIRSAPSCTYLYVGDTIIMLTMKPEELLAALYPDARVVETEIK